MLLTTGKARASKKNRENVFARARVDTDDESCEDQPADTPQAETTEDDTAVTSETNEREDTDDTGADSVAADDDDTTAPPVDTAGPRRWQRYVGIGLPVAVIVSLLALSGFLGWKVWQQHELDQAGHDAQNAAVRYAQELTSIDSNKVDQNFAAVLDGATGEFKDMYTQSSVQLRQLLIDNKATAHGVVIDSAVQSVSKNKVVVLLFIDQTVSNTTVPDPRVDRSRVRMTMENVDGHWLASKVEMP